jgi:hypothetical protein
MRKFGNTSRAKQAVGFAVSGGLFAFGCVVVATMYVLNRTLGGVELSPPTPIPGPRREREGALS